MLRTQLILGLMLLTLAATIRPAAADVDAPAVGRAIERGVAYLRKTQQERGGWDEFHDQPCGVSALCTLALLNAGVPRDDPAMVKALRHLRSFPPTKTYSVSLQTLVFCQAGAAGDLPRIRENVRWLTAQQKQQGARDRVGSWGYGGDHDRGDPSNAQFALLALGAAVDRGIEVDPAVFQLATEYWQRRQLPSGGWTYIPGNPTGSMTCAGIASLIIARGRLTDGAQQIAAQTIECCGGSDPEADPIEQGLSFLGNVFSVEANPGQAFYYYYYLYALERVGRLSGRRLIGGYDWYRQGAERLLELQDSFQGYWAGSNVEGDAEIATSFALLFLSKGKRQVVIGQLSDRSGAGIASSQHPDALRQLVRHIERDWGQDLTWQTIEGERATVENLLQTPVLVISGDRPLQFSNDLVERLGQYLEQGGSLLFEALAGDGCGDASGFEASVRELCNRWFDDAPLEKLPPDHPVWFAERRLDPRALGPDFWVYGVQACCRTSVFYVPNSLSCRWQLGDQLFRRADVQSPVRKQVQAAVSLGENVIAYATGRELKDKLETRVVLRTATNDEDQRGVFRIAALALGAGGNEARRALPHAAALIAERIPIKIAAVPEPVALQADALAQVPLLWIHGRTDFNWNEQERETLREYIRNGGFILATGICGSQPFADAFRRELKAVLPDSNLSAVGPDHPILTTGYGGYDIRSVTVRKPAQLGDSLAVTQRRQPPALEIAQANDVDAVFFSPLDISCALEGQNSVQCPGYGIEDATKIVTNLLLYALQQ